MANFFQEVIDMSVPGRAEKEAGKQYIAGQERAMAAQERMANKNLAFQREMYDQAREDYAPFRETGLAANERIRRLLEGDATAFEQSPGYQFRLGQGTMAANRAASAQGQLNTGAQQKALTRFGQGLASQEYGNYLANLLTASGRGQAAVGNVTSAGGQFAGQAGSQYQNLGAGLARGFGNIGSARAASTLGQRRAWMEENQRFWDRNMQAAEMAGEIYGMFSGGMGGGMGGGM